MVTRFILGRETGRRDHGQFSRYSSEQKEQNAEHPQKIKSQA